ILPVSGVSTLAREFCPCEVMAKMAMPQDQPEFIARAFTLLARPHTIAVPTYGPAFTRRRDGNRWRHAAQPAAHDCADAGGVGTLGPRHFCVNCPPSGRGRLPAAGNPLLLSFHSFHHRSLGCVSGWCSPF